MLGCVPLKSQYPEILRTKKEEQTAVPVPVPVPVHNLRRATEFTGRSELANFYGTRSQELVQQKEINKKGKKEKRRNQP